MLAYPIYQHYNNGLSHIYRAYSRDRFDVLVFCHKNRFVDLTGKRLSLGQSGRPLLIDTLATQRFSLLRQLVQSSSSDIDPSVSAQKLLTKVCIMLDILSLQFDMSEWTTSLQWTHSSPPAYYCPYISTFEEGTTSEQWTKCSSPTCPSSTVFPK